MPFTPSYKAAPKLRIDTPRLREQLVYNPVTEALSIVNSTDTQTPDTTLERKFRRLADQWRRETMFSSSSDERLFHDAYLKIIGIGPPAVPLILRELEQQGGHWFFALRMITEENPVGPDYMGNVKKMKEAWLQWGRQNHYL